MQGAAFQGAAQHQDRGVVRAIGSGRAQGRPQLLGDVGTDPGVRGRRGRQDRGARWQTGQQCANAPIVRAEVVPPVRDAVGLVDDHQCGSGRQVRQDLVTEHRVVESLGGDQQDIHLACTHPGLDLLPLGDVGRVHGHGPDPGTLSGGDLVAHQGKQRRDDDARPDDSGPAASAGYGRRCAGSPVPPALTQQHRRHEVHRRFSPASALDHQDPAVGENQRLDRPPLVLAQVRITAAHELAQDGLGALTQRRGEWLRALGALRVLSAWDRHGPTVTPAIAEVRPWIPLAHGPPHHRRAGHPGHCCGLAAQ